jgi:prepilin-type N-terminal cleavage/methylation domain-containing protein
VKLPLPIPVFPPDASSTRLRPPRKTSHAPRFTFHVSRFTSRGSRFTFHASRFTCQAFTLVEILVTIALLSFIILGLFAMFNQVQRAFRLSMNQVDQLEAGRAVTELFPREIEQIIPSGRPGPYAVNFYSQIIDSRPLTQSLPGTPVLRTNLLADCFMLLRQNQNWVGIGYCVRTNDINGRLWFPEVQGGNPGRMGVGTLYRFEATLPFLYPHGDPKSGLPQDPSQLFTAFQAACKPGSAASLNISNRICDGVIHFRFRAFNTNGILITLPLRAGTIIQYSGVAPGEIGLYRFCSNTVPASEELELGILEQHAWQRYLSIGTPAARLNYLRSPDYYLSSRVHLFRQRIPLRNVDPLAYQ